MSEIVQLNTPLNEDQLTFLDTFARSCRHSIIAMLKNSQSGHPGGSLSCLDYLTLLYTQLISQNGHKVVVSNGHISPAVYSVLAEMGYISKAEVIQTFRKFGSVFEGHITRHVPGIWYGTGPLGVGISVAGGFALASKLKDKSEKIYALIGDGEAQEGQVYETMQFAKKYHLDNLVVFVDSNQVQLTASLEDTMPINIKGHFEAAGWEVLETDGHDYQQMWATLGKANQIQGKPVVIIGQTIMGKGVDFMEETGRALKSDWHGKAPSAEQADQILPQLELNADEEKLLTNFRKNQIKWQPQKTEFPTELKFMPEIDCGDPIIQPAGTVTDCRSAYGKALLDLAQRNKNVLAISADLRGSVKTDGVAKELPEQHVEVGIAEQNMVSLAGGLSLAGLVPFCSTFGAFMTSRAKDQARVNDINQTNVKMVATHCGLSVGEDGPTHQAIDDLGSFLGLFNTMIIEPADANQTDHIIRYITRHYGNFYVRMGRHKFPVILKENGTVLYDEHYEYYYGRTDVVRTGTDFTIVASGSCVGEAIKAREELQAAGNDLKIEIVAVSSIKKFDQNLFESIAKTKQVITVEDHNPYSGLASQLSRALIEEGLQVSKMINLAPTEYQLSGTDKDLYNAVGINAEGIKEAIKS